MARDHRVVVGQGGSVFGQRFEVRPPGVRACLGIVFEQLVVGRQLQVAQHSQRRVAQQAGEPCMKGSELHRSATIEQAPIEVFQTRRRFRCFRWLDAAYDKFSNQLFRRALREIFKPLIEPLAHFASGLLGEGNGQDLVRFAGAVALFQQGSHDARHQHPGLARTGAGLDSD